MCSDVCVWCEYVCISSLSLSIHTTYLALHIHNCDEYCESRRELCYMFTEVVCCMCLGTLF